jgi:hypothetical protein
MRANKSAVNAHQRNVISMWSVCAHTPSTKTEALQYIFNQLCRGIYFASVGIKVCYTHKFVLSLVLTF